MSAAATPGGVPRPGDPPLRAHGTIALDPAACTSCMLCARECPDWCIYIESHAEEVSPPDTEAAGATTQAIVRGSAPGRAGRTRVVHRLDRFAIDFGLCLFCGICVEVCPFEALFWAPTAVRTGDLRELLVEQEELDAFRAALPGPQPLETGAVPPPPKDSGRARGGGRRGS